MRWSMFKSAICNTVLAFCESNRSLRNKIVNVCTSFKPIIRCLMIELVIDGTCIISQLNGLLMILASNTLYRFFLWLLHRLLHVLGNYIYIIVYIKRRKGNDDASHRQSNIVYWVNTSRKRGLEIESRLVKSMQVPPREIAGKACENGIYFIYNMLISRAFIMTLWQWLSFCH